MNQEGERSVYFEFYTNAIAGVVYFIASYGSSDPQFSGGAPLGEYNQLDSDLYLIVFQTS